LNRYTPQEGDCSEERLTPEDRARAIRELAALRHRFPKMDLSQHILDGYIHPPGSPEECIFAQSTTLIFFQRQRSGKVLRARREVPR
jgi:hypothetical protein